MLDKKQIIHFLVEEDKETLFRRADEVRRVHCGDEIHLRGIIEYSNFCRCNCEYCGLRAENLDLPRYRMTVDQVVEIAQKAYEQDLHTVVLQAGEDPLFPVDRICEMVSRIRKIGDIAVTLSCGEYERDEYSLMRDAGADRYLLKIETVNPKLYEKIHPGLSLKNRMRCLHDLKELGFQTGSGALIGLPGQTIEDIADDIFFCAEMECDMVSTSPFIPHPGTPLGSESGGTSLMGHRVISTIRLAIPSAHIPCSTALAAITPDDYRLALNAGANVIMADITPPEIAQYYDLYPGKVPKGDLSHRDNIKRLKDLIASLGRPLAESRGDSLRTTKENKC